MPDYPPLPDRDEIRQELLDKLGEKVIRLQKQLREARHQVRVGVAVAIVNDKREVLFGRRKGSHGNGTWSLPGGHVDFGEAPNITAYREVKEETGLDIALVAQHKLYPWGYAVFAEEDKQYITLFFTAKHLGEEPQRKEPEKCEGWEWFPIHRWPEPLFGALGDPVAIELLRQGLEELVFSK